jgi:hypothetical protein
MGNKIGLVVFLLVVVVQIIGAIVTKANKAQQQRAKTGGAPPRRLAVPTGPKRGAAGPLVRPPVAGRVDDLAARRRQQLEELRQRRAGTAPARARVGPAAPRPAAPSEAPSEGIQTMRADHAAVLAMEEELRRRRELERQREHAADDAATRLVEIEHEARHRAEQERQAAVQRAAQRRAAALRDAPRPAFGGTSPREIVAATRDPRTLRAIIVMRELLDPPLALRGD